jgi:hypothetical protein
MGDGSHPAGVLTSVRPSLPLTGSAVVCLGPRRQQAYAELTAVAGSIALPCSATSANRPGITSPARPSHEHRRQLPATGQQQPTPTDPGWGPPADRRGTVAADPPQRRRLPPWPVVARRQPSTRHALARRERVDDQRSAVPAGGVRAGGGHRRGVGLLGTQINLRITFRTAPTPGSPCAEEAPRLRRFGLPLQELSATPHTARWASAARTVGTNAKRYPHFGRAHPEPARRR